MAAAIVSVIVPNYNHARFLRQRLDTILAQTFPDFELILLDDCSSDGSQQILGEYASRPRVSHVVFNETNSGSTFKQWNKGVRLAHGEYVWIAESDDYSAPTFVGRMLAVLQSDPAITFAYCRSIRWPTPARCYFERISTNGLEARTNRCACAVTGNSGRRWRWKESLRT